MKEKFLEYPITTKEILSEQTFTTGQIHAMERFPFLCLWWNTPRIEQKVARGVRAESHKELPFISLDVQKALEKDEKEREMKRLSHKKGKR